MIVYYKLFRYIHVKGMKRTGLLKVISSPTLAKLGKNQVVQTDVINRICIFLNCQPSDIMECVFPPSDFEDLKYKR